MGTPIVEIDIAIMGGGIAGLWALNQLRGRGYSAVLFEQQALGSGQTISSQGIIHGGVKYALSGVLGGDSEKIAGMPRVWSDCLAGNGAVDLRGCQVLSENVYLWSNTGLSSRLGAFLASKLLRGRVEKLGRGDFPIPLQSPAFRGQVYRLADFVLDTRSLLQTLARQQREAIFAIGRGEAGLRRDGGRIHLALPRCTLAPQRLLLAAGAGNEALIAELGGAAPAMQRRPLQQVMVKHGYQHDFFAHCIDGGTSPRLTISSHRTRGGEPVWYLGGDIATEYAGEGTLELVARARRELAGLLPWIDLGPTEWGTLQIDRAEPRQTSLLRPDSAFVGRVEDTDNTLVTWPTKLSLAPDMGDAILQQLEADGIGPRHRPDLSLLGALNRPTLAEPPWDTEFR